MARVSASLHSPGYFDSVDRCAGTSGVQTVGTMALGRLSSGRIAERVTIRRAIGDQLD
jgi:hypothetical protein